MRILFLDDQPIRFHTFKKVSQDHEVDWAKNANEAIGMLTNNARYDLVCFDHDLGESHYQAFHQENTGTEADYGKEPTGYDVALFVVSELPVEKQPVYAIVHSFNNYGSKRITAALSEAGEQKAIFVFPFSLDGFSKSFEHMTFEE